MNDVTSDVMTWNFGFWIQAIYCVYAILIVLNILSKRISKLAKAIWVIVVLLFPLLGAWMFQNYIMARRNDPALKRRFNPKFNR